MNNVEHTPAGTPPVRLEAINIAKSFGGVRALKGVSLELRAGEVHALVGENGAGKSTLVKVLTGAVQADSGEVRFDGKRVEDNSPAASRALGIAAIYQQPALFPDLTVSENIGLAGGSLSRWRKVDWKRRRSRAIELLNRVGAQFGPDVLARTLTMPQQLLVGIAMALDAHAAVIIFDEPTASLGETDAENLFRIVADLRSGGAAIVYISHRFEELFRLADCVTILRDGSSVETRRISDITKDELIRLMVGRELRDLYPPPASQFGDIVMAVENVSCKQSGVKNVSLQIRSGEVLGLAGLVGSGRTQFAESLFGLAPMDTGQVRLAGKAVSIKSPADALQNGLAYVPEDRRRHGLVLDMSVATNTTLASLSKISTRGLIDFGKEQQVSADFIGRLKIKAPSPDTVAKNLSGGNQQKVALARWLLTKPRVLVLDEPTQGIDIGSKTEIYELIRRLTGEGTAILLISSDMEEILGMSDRIAVMAKGAIAGELSRSEATPYAVLAMALGHGTEMHRQLA